MKGENTRPPIPADLKRRILVEAGHRCAIPQCRSLVGVDIHHIVRAREFPVQHREVLP